MSFLHDEYEGKPMTTETPAADIVEQDHLRDQLTGRADFLRDKGEQKTPILLYQAADQITSLRAENAELQRKLDEAVRVLEEIAARPTHEGGCYYNNRFSVFGARAALTSIRGET